MLWEVGRWWWGVVGENCVSEFVSGCVSMMAYDRWTVEMRDGREERNCELFFLAMLIKLHTYTSCFVHMWVVAYSLAVISVIIIEKYRSNIHRIELKRLVINISFLSFFSVENVNRIKFHFSYRNASSLYNVCECVKWVFHLIISFFLLF